MRAEGFVPPRRKGRGGSVSRRDHSQAYRRRAQLAWAHKSEGTHKPIPSRSSGEGVWGGGGFSQRSRLLPRISPRILPWSSLPPQALSFYQLPWEDGAFFWSAGNHVKELLGG